MFNREEKSTIEELAATIAHEIKNPLSLVKANIALLESADKEQVYSKNYNVIKKELNKINDMVIDFLQLTKQSNSSNDIVYLFDIINQLLDDYKISLGENIKFYFNCSEKDIAILANEQNIFRVFLNLFKNAIESIDSDFGEIIINLYKEDNNAIVTIIDNGKGISKKDAEKIGEIFYTTKFDGNGLGLAICNKIILECNGEFSLKNNIGSVGCTSKVKLPIID